MSRNWVSILGLSLLMILSVVWLQGVQAQQESEPTEQTFSPQRWEYRIYETKGRFEQIEDDLNQLGAEGWEVITSLDKESGGFLAPGSPSGYLVLKRPREN